MRQTPTKDKRYGILEGMARYQCNLCDLLCFTLEKEW